MTETTKIAKPKKAEVIMVEKPSCLGEILCTLHCAGKKQEIEIVETIQLAWSKFLEFGDHLDQVYEWLVGKTGPGKAVNIIPPYGRYRKMHIVVIADKQGKPQSAGIKIKG